MQPVMRLKRVSVVFSINHFANRASSLFLSLLNFLYASQEAGKCGEEELHEKQKTCPFLHFTFRRTFDLLKIKNSERIEQMQ